MIFYKIIKVSFITQVSYNSEASPRGSLYSLAGGTTEPVPSYAICSQKRRKRCSIGVKKEQSARPSLKTSQRILIPTSEEKRPIQEERKLGVGI